MTSLRLNQKLTNAKGETATVTGFDAGPFGDYSYVKLSDGTTPDAEGWYFDPANPNAWRVVEEPEVKPKRTIDAIFEDIEALVGETGEEDYGAGVERVRALRAELKALVESMIEKVEKEESERISNSQDW